MTTSSHAGLAKPNLQQLHDLHFQDTEAARIRPIDAASLNHFQVFALEPRLCLDEAALRDSFLDLSRRIHPDYFADAPQDQREESLRRSSALNNAYKILRDLPRRAEYLVQLLSKDIQPGANAAPPELLEEMFDIQEAGEELKEARLAADAAKLRAAEERVKPLRADVLRSRDSLGEQLRELATRYDAEAARQGDPAAAECQQILREIRVVLDRMNYLRTVLRNLK